MRPAAVAVAALALVGCTTFEDPTIVRDLRVLAITADPPDQVIDVDLERPVLAELLAQLRPVELRTLIADPGALRPLRWSMTLCHLDDDGRCDRSLSHLELGAGELDDPDESPIAQVPVVVIEAAQPAIGQRLVAMMREAIEEAPASALGGVSLAAVLTVTAVDDPAAEVVAVKQIRISPRVPLDRLPNANPRVDRLESALASGAEVPLVRGQRCADVVSSNVATVRPGNQITLFPVEPQDVRERYVVPTLDGQVAVLEETLTYQWLATRGGWSDEVTGGGRDLLGNQSLLGSDWTAPTEVAAPILVSLWMIQRDERLGVLWFETCVRVVP